MPSGRQPDKTENISVSKVSHKGGCPRMKNKRAFCLYETRGLNRKSEIEKKQSKIPSEKGEKIFRPKADFGIFHASLSI